MRKILIVLLLGLFSAVPNIAVGQLPASIIVDSPDAVANTANTAQVKADTGVLTQLNQFLLDVNQELKVINESGFIKLITTANSTLENMIKTVETLTKTFQLLQEMISLIEKLSENLIKIKDGMGVKRLINSLEDLVDEVNNTIDCLVSFSPKLQDFGRFGLPDFNFGGGSCRGGSGGGGGEIWEDTYESAGGGGGGGGSSQAGAYIDQYLNAPCDSTLQQQAQAREYRRAMRRMAAETCLAQAVSNLGITAEIEEARSIEASPIYESVKPMLEKAQQESEDVQERIAYASTAQALIAVIVAEQQRDQKNCLILMQAADMLESDPTIFRSDCGNNP